LEGGRDEDTNNTLVLGCGLGGGYVNPPSTPVAVITYGTTPHQRCVTGTLQDIVERVKAENLQPPSVVVVGEVVRFRERLDWFNT